MKNKLNLFIPKLIIPFWRNKRDYIKKIEGIKESIGVHGIVVAVKRPLGLEDADIAYLRKLGFVSEVENIVTNDGDLFYAERSTLRAVGATITPVPTNFTDANGVPDMIMELYDNTGIAPAKTNNRSSPGTIIGSGKAIDSGYPAVNDGDSDNTGAAVDSVTYRVSFLTSEVNGSIDDVILTNPTPGASEPIIQHADGLAVTKTSSDTLKVFVNHNFLGS